jgi:hypothetical protein
LENGLGFKFKEISVLMYKINKLGSKAIKIIACLLLIDSSPQGEFDIGMIF